MGAWSHEPFGNDDANDWAYELEETDDLSLIEAALDVRDSELKDLWHEDDATEWEASLKALHTAVSA